MAELFNAIKYAPEIARATRTFMGMEGEHGIIGVDEQAHINCDIWDVYLHPDIAYLRGEKLCGARRVSAAVAGEVSAVAIVNPTGSGVLMVVDRAHAIGSAAMRVDAATASETTIAATLTVSAQGASLDTRNGAGAGARFQGVIYSGSDPASFGSIVEEILVSTTEALDFKTCVPTVLEPATGLVFLGVTVNTAVTVSVRWRERRLQPGELYHSFP
jgi:hypothetical protein